MSSYRTKSDLPQGGLEIPCVYTFTGVSAHINKVKKLLTDHATIPEAKNTTDTYGDDEIDLTDVDETVKKEKNRRYLRDTFNNGYYNDTYQQSIYQLMASTTLLTPLKLILSSKLSLLDCLNNVVCRLGNNIMWFHGN